MWIGTRQFRNAGLVHTSIRTSNTENVFMLPAPMGRKIRRSSGGPHFVLISTEVVVCVFDYYYGAQSDQFSFIRVPVVFFRDEKFKKMSTDAKVLYGILLNRMDLSAKNGWFDEQGRVYIICTMEEIMETMNCADNKATKLMDELEDKCGLIERKRQGQGRPNLIYVKNFISSVENSGSDSSESRFKTRDNHDSKVVKTAIPDSLKARGSNIDKNKINKSYTENHPIRPGSDKDGMGSRRLYEAYFRDSLEFETLLIDHPSEKEILQGILALLVDTCCSKRTLIRIAGDDKPKDIVVSQLMKLNFMHIQYVLDSFRANASDIRNIKQYLLAALYNAPMTMDSYYRAKVNYDFS